jgi:hypothetical protein
MNRIRRIPVLVAFLMALPWSHTANADLGLWAWGHHALAGEEDVYDSHSIGMPITPGSYMQDTFARVNDTSVSAMVAASLAEDEIEMRIVSDHIAWPLTPGLDGEAIARISSGVSLAPDQDTVVTALATASCDLPVDESYFNLSFLVRNHNQDLIHQADSSVGVPGVDPLILDDQFTLLAGSIYYVDIFASLTTEDEPLPISCVTANSTFNLTIAHVPEPTMLVGMLVVAASCVRRERTTP